VAASGNAMTPDALNSQRAALVLRLKKEGMQHWWPKHHRDGDIISL
jgi:hypothetical protein